jgi:hypothetical protein
MPQTRARGRCGEAVSSRRAAAIGLTVAALCVISTGAGAQVQPEGGAAGQPQQQSSAPGQMLDLGNATCAQFLGLSRMEKDQITLWLAGFYAGSAQRPRIDVSLLAGASGALDGLCARAPSTPLIGQETRPLLLR